jgi:hypothetical protein
MYELKTKENDLDGLAFIEKIEHAGKKTDALQLLDLFADATETQAKMWGESIIGFGSYHYRYASGHEGDAAIVGFSPRKAKISLYIYLSEEQKLDWLPKLGKHSIGASCIYINKLADIDPEILTQMIKIGWQNIVEMYPKQSVSR